MARKTLRPHQEEAIKRLRLSIVMGRRRPLLQAPCGFGKTVVASALIHAALAKGRRAIFVVPSLSLIDQTVDRLAEDGITAVGVIQADHPRTDPKEPVQIASVQTLLNRSLTGRVEKAKRKRSIGVRDEAGRLVYETKIVDVTVSRTIVRLRYMRVAGSAPIITRRRSTTRPVKVKREKRVLVRESVEKDVSLEPIPLADLVIIDECHQLFDLYAEWMAHPLWAHIPFVGLSATPWTRGLGKVFDALIKPISMQDLIDQGFLSPFRVYAPSHPDLSKVRSVAGEYREDDLEEVMNTPALTADIVATWQRLGNHEPTVCFAVNRLHAKTLQVEFMVNGIPAAYVDAFTPREERQEILEKFRSGDVKILCNVDVYSKGFDEDVRCLIMARPSRSEMWFTQAVGRVLRTAPGKRQATILDHSDNHLRLGFVTEIDHDRLDDGSKKPKKERESETEERLPKECPSCHALRPPKMKSCPSCGFTPNPKSDITCAEGDLVELTKGKKKQVVPKSVLQAYYSMLLGMQQERAYKPGWAQNTFRKKFNQYPRDLAEFPLPPNDEVRRFVQHCNMRRAFGLAKAYA